MSESIVLLIAVILGIALIRES